MKNLFLIIVFQIVAIQIGIGQINNKRIEFPIQGTDLESFNIPIGDQGVIVLSQLNTNIMCSYIFTLFLGLLGIFVVKSFIV